jgi:hypothetical protein
MRSNLILFILLLVLVNQNFLEDDDEGGSRRDVAQRAKATHLTSVICLLYSEIACGTS